MAKLAEPLVSGRNTGKVPNRKVAKSHFLLLVLDKSFALIQLSRDNKFHSKKTPMNCASCKQRLFGIRTRFGEIADFLILKYCDPVLGYPFLHY